MADPDEKLKSLSEIKSMKKKKAELEKEAEIYEFGFEDIPKNKKLKSEVVYVLPRKKCVLTQKNANFIETDVVEIECKNDSAIQNDVETEQVSISAVQNSITIGKCFCNYQVKYDLTDTNVRQDRLT